MAKISTATNEKIFQIVKWLGVNECPDGDTNLRIGEAAVMQNFRVTDNGSLQIRPGTQNIAGLINAPAITTSATASTLVTETGATTQTYALYPTAALGASGMIALSGTGVTANYANHADYVNYYYDDGMGNVYKFSDCVYDSDLDTYSWQFYPVTLTGTDTAVCGIWSGYVDGTEYLVAACNGHLWSLTESDGAWTRTNLGAVATSNGHVHMFGFGGKLYILDGTDYLCWDGTTLDSVDGYVPLVSTATPPTGGGTLLEDVNKLTAKRRCRFSPASSATVFQLPETSLASIDSVQNLTTGSYYTLTTDYTVSTTNGTVTFTTAPTTGTNTIEVIYTASASGRSTVTGMKYSELYNGTTDTRVFLYGDGTNTAIYSDLDVNGLATAEYFPDLNVMGIGASNVPITSIIRHYNRLLVLKTDSAYSVYYDTITLADGTVTAGFYITPVNRSIGNCAPGQAVLVENRPRAFDGNSIYEWRATNTSGNVTGDQRNAKRISQKVGSTLLNFVLSNTIAYYDKFNHEYYAIYNGNAIVQNAENDAWYTYANFDATCIVGHADGLYIGREDGYIRRVSRDYMHDNGENIEADWESGAMSFGADFKYKYSASLWVGLKPEIAGTVNVAVQTDRQSIDADSTKAASAGLFSFETLDFTRLSFEVSNKPKMTYFPAKVKKFIFYKLIFTSDSNNTTATITSADVKVRYTSNVR